MGYKSLDYFSNYDVVYKRALSEVEHQMDLYVDEMDGNLRIALARQKSWVRTDVDTYDWIYRMSFKYKCYRLLYNLVKEQNILSYSQLYLLALGGDNVNTAVSQLEDMLDIEEILGAEIDDDIDTGVAISTKLLLDEVDELYNTYHYRLEYMKGTNLLYFIQYDLSDEEVETMSKKVYTLKFNERIKGPVHFTGSPAYRFFEDETGLFVRAILTPENEEIIKSCYKDKVEA